MPDILIKQPKPLADDFVNDSGQVGFNLTERSDDKFDLTFSMICHDGEYRPISSFWLSKEGVTGLANFLLSKVNK